jgi:hypothetical protein
MVYWRLYEHPAPISNAGNFVAAAKLPVFTGLFFFLPALTLPLYLYIGKTAA